VAALVAALVGLLCAAEELRERRGCRHPSTGTATLQ
jgi:hypothetical protein